MLNLTSQIIQQDKTIENDKRDILIIDDDDISLHILEHVLTDIFTNVTTTTYGEKALELIEENHYDLVICDLNLPDIHGFEICKNIKENPKTLNIPIIFITASRDFEDEVKGLNIGASDFIHKPFIPSVVNYRVDLHINLHKKIEMLDKLVRIDDLTGIYNRREYNNKIEMEINRAQRTQTPLALLMIDIDYFKLYNDTYGHGLGDKCLIKIAKTINNIGLRKSDLFARYGGEEFVIVLPNTNLDGAILVANRVMKSINDLKEPHKSSKVSEYVTLSVGIASIIPQKETSVVEFESLADKELYKAKENGRNQISYLTDQKHCSS